MAAKSLKILVLSHTGDMLGGAEMSMLDVFDELARKYNVEPEFIIREPVRGMAGELKKRGWKYRPLSYTFWSDGNPPTTDEAIANNAKRNLQAIVNIEKIINEVKPSLVVTNSIVCPWAAIAAYNKQIPHTWFIREYGDIDHGRIFSIDREKIMNDIDTTSQLVITISKALKKHLDQYINPNKVKILYNPFKVDEIKKRSLKKFKTPFKNPESLKLIISGNIAPTKGQLEAVEATGRLNREGHDVELCVVGREGESEIMGKIHTVINKYKIQEKVHFIGFQRDLLAYVKLADLGIMASRMEGFGRVTFEYLVLGKPVIGADAGATPELVINGVNGYLYNPSSVDSLTKVIKHYTNNPQLIKKHSVASSKHAKEMISGEFNIDAVYKFIENTAKIQPQVPTASLHIIQQLNKDVKLSGRKTLKNLIYNLVKRVYHKLRTLKAGVSGR